MDQKQIDKLIDVLYEVKEERMRQENKFGQQNRHPGQYAIILHEEVGEVAKEVCEIEFADDEDYRFERLHELRKELLQVAAVAVAMVECLDRNELNLNPAQS